MWKFSIFTTTSNELDTVSPFLGERSVMEGLPVLKASVIVASGWVGS